jgi:hypothetical protein
MFVTISVEIKEKMLAAVTRVKKCGIPTISLLCRKATVFSLRLGIKKLRNKNEQPTILLLLLLSDLPQIFPLSSSSDLPHDPIFIDSIAIHFRILCHHISFKFISSLHCDQSIQ